MFNPVSPQNTLVIDTPRVRKQTRHYSSVKEEEMMEFSELESDEDEPSKPSSKPRRPQDKAQGYPRSECFRVEKNLLVYGSVALFTQSNRPTEQVHVAKCGPVLLSTQR